VSLSLNHDRHVIREALGHPIREPKGSPPVEIAGDEQCRSACAYIDLYPIATGNMGALEGYGPRLANTDGRSIVESCLIDM
jgi:hypothetical protein